MATGAVLIVICVSVGLIAWAAATTDYRGLSEGDTTNSYIYIDFNMNISMPWQYCMELDANETHESLICDRIPLYEAVPQIQDLWRTQAENIRFVQLDCRKGCWCMDIPVPDENADDLEECEPETEPQYHYPCNEVEVSTRVLNKMKGLKRFFVNDIQIVGEPLDFLNDSQQMREIHFIHTNMVMRQLPDFCDFTNLESLILIGNQLQPDMFNQTCEQPGGFPNMLKQLILIGESIESLPDGPLFADGVNVTDLSLARNHISHVPRDAFKGLSKLIYLDLADNRLTNISNINWRNARQIKRMNISHNDLTEIQCARLSDLTRLEDLDLSNNLITTIKGEFNVLSKLEWLVLSNNRLVSIGHHFSGCASLVRLDLSWNNFTSLPSRLTKEVPSLAILDLAGNNLQPHDVNEALVEEQVLDVLDLSYNNITSLHNTSLSNMARFQNIEGTDRFLEHYEHGCLDMRGNRISVLHLDVFANIKQISTLDFSLNQIESIELGVRFTTKITTLKLNNNFLKSTPTDLKKLNIERLYLANNNISHLEHLNLTNSLKNLDLRWNGIHRLDNGQTLSNLEELNLAHNNISQSSVGDSGFCESYPKLRRLNFTNNRLTDELFEDTGNWLSNCYRLEDVDLSYNHVEDVNFIFSERPWSSVSSLRLRGNKLTVPLPSTFSTRAGRVRYGPFDEDLDFQQRTRGAFQRSSISVRHLDLSACGIKSVPTGLFFETSNLNTADLSDNEIETIQHMVERLPYARVLLYRNKLRATCNMAWLKYSPELRRFYRFTFAIDVVSEEKDVFDDIAIQHFLCVTHRQECDAKCVCLSIASNARPSRLMCNGRGLTKAPEHLPISARYIYMENNNIKRLDFNEGPGNSIHDEALAEKMYLKNSSIETVADDAFVRFPKLAELYLDDNRLVKFDMNVFVELKSLEILSLSYNNISEVIAPKDDFTVLRELNLKSNQIANISAEVHKHLLKQTHLVLSDNPWECDSCSGLVAFLAKISHYAVQNIDRFMDLECHNLVNTSVRQMVTDFDSGQCSEDTPEHVKFGAGGVSVTVMSCVIVLIIPAIYVCRVQLSVLAHTAVPAMRRRRAESPLPYDAFVIYNGRDAVRHWVIEDLRPRLEDIEGYRLFLMERDSVGGSDEMAARRVAMKHCKRTIFVVGEDISSDPYCLYSFHLAHRFATDDDHHAVLVILNNGNNPAAAREHDTTLKAYINTNRYIAVESRLFWQTLVSQMPYQPDSLEERMRHFNNIDPVETRDFILPYDYVNRYRQTVSS